jgi:hypothetical protein
MALRAIYRSGSTGGRIDLADDGRRVRLLRSTKLRCELWLPAACARADEVGDVLWQLPAIAKPNPLVRAGRLNARSSGIRLLFPEIAINFEGVAFDPIVLQQAVLAHLPYGGAPCKWRLARLGTHEPLVLASDAPSRNIRLPSSFWNVSITSNRKSLIDERNAETHFLELCVRRDVHAA